MSPEEPEFLTVEEVLALHADQLAHFGGAAGVRNLGGLESAVSTPKASFGGAFLHDGLFEMAAAYAFHIAENQPFVDGNKRTALNAALVFLDLNGFVVHDPRGPSLRCDDRHLVAVSRQARARADPLRAGSPPQWLSSRGSALPGEPRARLTLDAVQDIHRGANRTAGLVLAVGLTRATSHM